jgi:hypothetical protein
MKQTVRISHIFNRFPYLSPVSHKFSSEFFQTYVIAITFSKQETHISLPHKNPGEIILYIFMCSELF